MSFDLENIIVTHEQFMVEATAEETERDGIFHTSDTSALGLSLMNSGVVADYIMMLLISDVASCIQDKYINAKIISHTNKLSLEITNSLISVNGVESDKGSYTHVEDDEPLISRTDNWARYQLAYLKRDGSDDAPSELGSAKPVMMIFDENKSIEKARERAKMHLLRIEPSMIPVPVSLNEAEEINKLEQKMRLDKENYLLRLQSEQNKRKIEDDLLKEHKLRLQKTQQDMKKNKKFTYDFDGKLILCNTLNPEKMPPTAYIVEHKINEDAPPEKSPRKKKNEAEKIFFDAGKSPLKPKKHREESDYQQMMKYSAPNVFEDIQPRPGVVFKDEGRTKKGNQISGMNNLTLPSLTSTITSWGKMTKMEYDSMVKGGSHNRTQKAESKVEALRMDTTSASGLKSIAEKSFKTLRSESSEKSIEVNKLTTEKKLMKVHSSKLLESLLKPSSEKELKAVFNKDIKINSMGYTIDDTLKKTRIDDFNLSIMNSKDWGKGNSLQVETQMPAALPPRKIHRRENSLGTLMSKGPRDRLGQTMSGTFYSTKSQNSTSSKWFTPKTVVRASHNTSEMFF